jgi:hypothetical protein
MPSSWNAAYSISREIGKAAMLKQKDAAVGFKEPEPQQIGHFCYPVFGSLPMT